MSPMAEAARTRRLPPGLRRDLLGGLLMLAVDVVAPVAGYYLLRAAGVEPVPALLLSGIPPAVRVLARLARGRRPDALGLIVLGVIALSSIAAAFSGTARTLLVRNAIVGFPFALWTLASARAKRPLTYDVALSAPAESRGEPGASVEWERHLPRRLATPGDHLGDRWPHRRRRQPRDRAAPPHRRGARSGHRVLDRELRGAPGNHAGHAAPLRGDAHGLRAARGRVARRCPAPCEPCARRSRASG